MKSGIVAQRIYQQFHFHVKHVLRSILIALLQPCSRRLPWVQDYNDDYKVYKPEVERSQLISRNGKDSKIYLRYRDSRKETEGCTCNAKLSSSCAAFPPRYAG